MAKWSASWIGKSIRMNNKEYISELSRRTGYTQEATRRFVSAVMETLAEHLSEEEALQVPNFGTFEVKKRMEKVMVSPTGSRMLVPPKLVLNFRPIASVKQNLKKGGGND